MPRRLRKEKRRRELTVWMKEGLFSGHNYLTPPEGYGSGDAFDEAAARADWTRNGLELMTLWFGGFLKPDRQHDFGSPKCDHLRPFAWYLFDLQASRPEGGAQAEYALLRERGLLVDGDEHRRDLLVQAEQAEPFTAAQRARFSQQKAAYEASKGGRMKQ